jgi:hypothetical protein
MSLAPDPAWTKEIDGKAYTVKRAGQHVFSIWHRDEELGLFELLPNTAHGPAAYAALSQEARAVANAFVEQYRDEHPAT